MVQKNIQQKLYFWGNFWGTLPNHIPKSPIQCNLCTLQYRFVAEHSIQLSYRCNFYNIIHIFYKKYKIFSKFLYSCVTAFKITFKLNYFNVIIAFKLVTPKGMYFVINSIHTFIVQIIATSYTIDSLYKCSSIIFSLYNAFYHIYSITL